MDGKGTMNAQMQGPRPVAPELAGEEFPWIALAEGCGTRFDGLSRP